jgi:hypothetical protein
MFASPVWAVTAASPNRGIGSGIAVAAVVAVPLAAWAHRIVPTHPAITSNAAWRSPDASRVVCRRLALDPSPRLPRRGALILPPMPPNGSTTSPRRCQDIQVDAMLLLGQEGSHIRYQ